MGTPAANIGAAADYASGSRFDLATFGGRFWHFVEVTDPRGLLYSKAQIEEAAVVLKRYKETGLSCGTASDMWGYRKVVDSCIHPSSGKEIPSLFRVSAIAPVNIPIVFGMLACPPSNVVGTLGLHFINQSYNSACNYANRSGSSSSSPSDSSGDELRALGSAYALAISSACAIAYFLGKAVDRGPPALKKLGFIIPCVATSAANFSNLFFTRSSELINGTPVYDREGKVHGASPIAGRVAVQQTALTRGVLVPCAVLITPPIAMSGLRLLGAVPSSGRGAMLLELAIIYASLQAALPAALAVYPQASDEQSLHTTTRRYLKLLYIFWHIPISFLLTFQTISIPVKTLEPQFRSLKDSSGRVIDTLYCNKGL